MVKRRLSDYRLIYKSSYFCLNISNYAIVFTTTNFCPLIACIVIKEIISFLPVITKLNYSTIKMTDEDRFKGAIHKHLLDP